MPLSFSYSRATLKRLTEGEQDRYIATTVESGRHAHRATESLVGGVASSYHQHVPWPLEFVRGRGCTLWDTDGVSRTDYHAGFGVMVHGHAHPAIDRFAWLYFANRGIFVTPARPWQSTLSIAHDDDDVDAYLSVVDGLLGEIVSDGPESSTGS